GGRERESGELAGFYRGSAGNIGKPRALRNGGINGRSRGSEIRAKGFGTGLGASGTNARGFRVRARDRERDAAGMEHGAISAAGGLRGRKKNCGDARRGGGSFFEEQEVGCDCGMAEPTLVSVAGCRKRARWLNL